MERGLCSVARVSKLLETRPKGVDRHAENEELAERIRAQVDSVGSNWILGDGSDS